MANTIPIFDSHFHIIDRRFPLVANQGYVPQSFTCEDYLNRTKDLNIVGGAVVSGSFHGFDQGYLIDALNTLGPSFVGVTQLPPSVSDEEVIRLNKAGVRAIRCNLRRMGPQAIEHTETLAKRVYEIARWHVEFYLGSKDLPHLFPLLSRLPSISIDHLGLSREGFPYLLRLVEKGARVKASGFGRVELNVKEALITIHSINPQALMFGTDLPSTRSPRPFSNRDIRLVLDALGEDAIKVFYHNAIDFYRPEAFLKPQQHIFGGESWKQ